MYIQSFQIDAFGVLQGLMLENIPQGLSIFLGKNEAGKSTLFNFFRYMLDVSNNKQNSTIKNYLKNHSKAGGSLTVDTNQYGTIHLTRYPKNAVIIDSLGKPLAPYLWENLFHGITQEVYNNIYSFSLTELQELNTLRSEGVRNALYGASFGTGISSPSEVIKKLTGLMNEYITPRSTKKFDEDLQEWEKVTNQIKNAEQDSVAYDTLQYELSSAKEQKEKIEKNVEELKKHALTLKKKIDYWGKWEEWQKQHAELKHLSIPKRFPPDGVSRLKEYLQIKNEKIQEATILKKHIDSLRYEIKKYEVNTSLLEIETDLLSALEYKASFITAEQTIFNLRLTLEKKTIDLQQHLTYLGETWSIEKIQQTDHSLATKEYLRNLDTEIQKTKHNYEAIQKQLKEITEQYLVVQNKEQEAKQAYENLSIHKNKEAHPCIHNKAWLRELRDTFIHYEKAIAINNTKQLQNIHPKVNNTLKKRSLTITQILGLSLIVIGTLGLTLPYFDLDSTPIANIFLDPWLKYLSLGSGGIISISAWLLKLYVCNQQTKDTVQLPEETHKLQELEQKLQKLCTESGIDFKQISAQYINDLEDKSEHEHNKILQTEQTIKNALIEKEQLENKIQALKGQKHIYTQKLNDTYSTWNNYINKLNLEPRFSFSALEVALDRMNLIETLHSEYVHIEKTIMQHERNKHAFILPLKNIAQKLNQSQDKTCWLTFFTALSKELEQAKELHKQQENLKKEEKNAHNMLTQTSVFLENISEKIKNLLSVAEAKDEDEFLHKGNQQQRYEEIKQVINPLEEFFIHTFDCHTEELASFLHTFFKEDILTIEKKYEELLVQINNISKHKEELSKQIHEQEFSLKKIASSTELSHYRIKEARLKNTLNEYAKQWTCYALAKELLMEAKLHFEQERQPEIIQAASKIFNTITNGKWKGINASLEDMSLNVIPSHGEPFDPAMLSRGTQEQLYLALRVAHIHNHATRATPLPIIMDDILVNFDRERALYTTKTFMELLKPTPKNTKGHQILFFTCHEHIAKQIQEVIPNSNLYAIENKTITLSN